MIEPEMAFCELDGNVDSRRGLLEARVHACSGSLPRRHGVLQRANRQDGARDVESHHRDALRADHLHRRDRNPRAQRRGLRVSGEVGHGSSE